MQRSVVKLFFVIFLGSSLLAQNSPLSERDFPVAVGQHASLTTQTSPLREPEANDHVFVRGEQSGALDTGCVTNTTLRIVLPINRVIDKNSVDGTISQSQ